MERPEQVLAITFTRKAAAEMRERVMEALDAAKQGIQAENEHEARTQSLADAVLAHSRALNWSLTAESLNIRTIDGLAAQLNRVMPVLSGLGGGITVTDDVLPLYQKATSELYELVGEESSRGEALRQLLLSMDNNWQRCSELLIECWVAEPTGYQSWVSIPILRARASDLQQPFRPLSLSACQSSQRRSTLTGCQNLSNRQTPLWAV